MEPVVELVDAPALLVELPSRFDVFRRNLLDLLRPQPMPPLRLASKPADFWPDVFVPNRLPWRYFSESGVYHVLFALILWGSSIIWARRPQIAMQPVFTHQDVIYYQASELLTPIDTGSARPKETVKGEPAYAPQPIISVPREADNHRQTVVAPPQMKLDHDVPLPNVVSWPKAPLEVPIAATARTVMSKAPSLDTPVVAPAPEVKLASSRSTIHSLQPTVVQPTPQMDTSPNRRMGEMNIAPAQVVAPAPQLSVAAQRAPSGQPGLGSATAVVPPPPSVSGDGTAKSGGRLIALGLNPTVGAPIEPPSGNRRGSFAATPQGKPGAAGTPDIAGNGHNSEAGAGNGGHSDVPAGLYVGKGTGDQSAIGGNGKGSGNGNGAGQSKDSALIAKATAPPRVSATLHRQAEEVSGAPENEAERKVFGDRKFYAMTQSIPNLNSSSGSWTIHFAELDHGSAGVPKSDGADLAAPVPTAMSDPAYPLELIKQHIEGTVTLYAVIGADGVVSDVRVMNGIDDRLNEYARAALLRWRFRPASKNGNPVALEAVVRVPFRAGRARSSF